MTTNGSSRLYYLDSSAIAKFVVPETESVALAAFLSDPDLRRISSSLALVEVVRLAFRRSPYTAQVAQDVLETIELVELTESVLSLAASLAPRELRTLDAIHVATARQYASELTALITYDHRMRDAAQAAGFTVEAPGQ